MPNEGEKNLIGTCGWRAHDFSPRQVQLMHPGWNLMKLVMPNVKLKKPNIISKFMGLLALKISVKTNYIFGIMFCSYVFWINDWVMFMTKNWLGLWSFCSVVSSSHQFSKRKQTKLTRSILHSQKGVCFVAYYHMCLSIFKY